MDLTLVIPVFQSAATIERTARSLALIGSPARVQVIVVDDGSSDGSAELARAELSRLGWGTLEVLRQENGGSASARNRGLSAARSPWLLFLDADDELAADPLPLIDRTRPGTSALLASAELVRAGRVRLRYRPPALRQERARRLLSTGNPLPISAALLRRELVTRPFDASLRYLEDWAFWIENPALFAAAVRVPGTVLCRIHAHGANKSGHYAAIGACRERIAEAQLRAGAPSLVERHNWTLQREVGRLLQGRGTRASAALLLPCTPSLYLKFLAYALARRAVLARDPYAPDGSASRGR